MRAAHHKVPVTETHRRHRCRRGVHLDDDGSLRPVGFEEKLSVVATGHESGDVVGIAALLGRSSGGGGVATTVERAEGELVPAHPVATGRPR